MLSSLCEMVLGCIDCVSRWRIVSLVGYKADRNACIMAPLMRNITNRRLRNGSTYIVCCFRVGGALLGGCRVSLVTSCCSWTVIQWLWNPPPPPPTHPAESQVVGDISAIVCRETRPEESKAAISLCIVLSALRIMYAHVTWAEEILLRLAEVLILVDFSLCTHCWWCNPWWRLA